MKTKTILSLIFLCVLTAINAQIVTTFAGSGTSSAVDGAGTAAGFYYPQKMCADGAGNMYVADYYGRKIRKITTAGVVTTIAGTGALGNIDGPASSATFNKPVGICIDASGNIYVADEVNNNIRKITPAGMVSTFAGSTTAAHGYANGTGTAAKFYCPADICMDAAGNFYVTDGCNNRIRMITPAGVVSTFAGSGVSGSTDATGIAASFYYPNGICLDATGNFYVCDLLSHKIRKMTPAGAVTTFAGSGIAGSTDGPGSSARFNYPNDICVDPAGNFYVADKHSYKIRKINPSGVVSTYAGSGALGSTDGIGTAASFSYPAGVYADDIENVYVCDLANNKIRKICVPCTILPYDYVVYPGGTTSSALFGGATNIVNKNIYVQGPLTIDNNITFSGCNLVMKSSVGISLTTGDLTLSNQTHMYACENMWNGITVGSGRTLSTTGSVWIEDALQAVNITTGGAAAIDQTIFNLNLTAIEVATNTSTTFSPLSISNSVITSRNIPSLSPSLNPTVADVITSISGASPYTTAVLKAPYSGRKGCYGIEATDVYDLNVGVPSAGMTNYFDAIMCGISLTRTHAWIYNNNFQYLLGYAGLVACVVGSPCYYEKGYGILASGSTTGQYSITVGALGTDYGNSFYNTYGATSISDYYTHTVTNNKIINTSTGPFTITTTGYGNTGIYVRPRADQNISIISNAITNCATGISLSRPAAVCIYSTGTSIAVTTNTINADASGYCTTGINMQDITGSNTAPPDVFTITSNTITEAQTCISASYVKSGLLISDNNNMGIAYNATALRYGIRLQNCEYAKAFKNTNIHCTTPNIYTNAGANIKGIYVFNTRTAQVQCNEINNVSQALTFEGACTGTAQPTLVRGNSFNSCYHGLYMKNNAEINTQGNYNVPSDNYYYGPFASGFQTFTDNVSNVNTNSVFYVRSSGGAVTVPTLHGGVNPYVNGTGIISISAPAFIDCSTMHARLANDNEDQALNTLLTNEDALSNAGKTNIISTLLYPNPNNGKMTLDYSIPENEKGILTIRDVTGKTISTYSFESSAKQLTISEEELNEGIYFYEINVSNRYIKRDKLIIAK